MTSQTPPLKASAPKAPARRIDVVDRIRRQIVEGDLIDGQRLNERDLSLQFGVSRVPVREALLVLAGEGMVEMRPRQGAFVAPLTRRVVRELFEVRGALEPMAAHWSALRATPAHLVEFGALVERARNAALSHDIDKGSHANTDFHELLFRASGNDLLGGVMPAVIGITRRVFRLSIVDHETMRWEEHRDIVRAIERGDPDEAAALTAAHLEHTRRHTFEIFDSIDDEPPRQGSDGGAAPTR